MKKRQTTSYKLQATSYELQATSDNLKGCHPEERSDEGPQTTSYELQATSDNLKGCHPERSEGPQATSDKRVSDSWQATQILIFVLAVVVLGMAPLRLRAQTQQATPLQTLGWLNVAGNANYTAERANTVDFGYADCLVGWNWFSTSRPLSELYNTRFFHCQSQALHSNVLKFPRTFIPGQRLVPNVHLNNTRIETITEGGLTSDNIPDYLDIYESGAMEWQPWLRAITPPTELWLTPSFMRKPLTDVADIPTDDVVGGVFCFGSQTQAGYKGTRVNSAGVYRLHLDAADALAPVNGQIPPILHSVWPDDGMLRWNPIKNDLTMTELSDTSKHRHRESKCIHNRNQNTSRLYVSITLRRTEDDAVGADPDEVIVRLRVPYWYYEKLSDTHQVRTNAAQYAIFDSIPSATGAASILNYGALWGLEETASGQFPTELLITRRMLPAVADPGNEVTISGYMLFDVGAKVAPTERHQRQLNTWDSHDANLVERLGAEVYYEGHIGIDIRNVRIETPEARRVLWGGLDAQVAIGVNIALDHIVAAHNVVPGGVPANADRARIARFYGRDEPHPMHWRTMRHLQKLLHGQVTTEWHSYWHTLAEHCMELPEWWQGQEAMPSPGPLMPSMVFKKGHNPAELNTVSAYNHAGIWMGTHNPEAGYDPEPYVSNGGVQQLLPLANVLSSVYNHKDRTKHGYLATFETMLFHHYANQPHILFGNKSWMANPWLYLDVQGFGQRDGMTEAHDKPPRLWFRNQPRTMGFVRHAVSWPLLFGAKNLAIYAGTSAINFKPVVPNMGNDDPPLINDIGVQNNEAVVLAAGQSAQQFIAADDQLGTDYILDPSVPNNGDIGNLAPYFYGGFNNVASHLHGVSVSPGAGSIYVGRRTTRLTLLEMTDWFNNMYERLGRETFPARLAVHPLFDARLVAWHAKGFSSWTQHHAGMPANTFSLFVDTTRIRSRHPMRIRERVNVGAIPGHFDYEPHDSTFVDITMLDLPATGGGRRSVHEVFLLGVSNRRTDSRMRPADSPYVSAHTADWEHVDIEEYRNRVALNASNTFMQKGARQITIPFNYAHADGRYRLLRLQEMGGGIDTVIGQDRELAVNFLPGEGKMFRVSVLGASEENIARGWLDHNTQRKMVAFPEADGAEARLLTRPQNGPNCSDATITVMKHGTHLRYHMVYHRRVNPDPIQGANVLAVYYRRSAPLEIGGGSDVATSADAGNIEWEPEILLSNTLWPAERLPSFPSCAYPSIVVRYDATENISKVYVVYSCEQTTPNAPDIAIVEAQLWADAPTHAVQESIYQTTMRSYRIDEVHSSPRQNCANEYEGISRLKLWGTPVINASHEGNYYAWSDHHRGIVYGFKAPNARAFTVPPLESVRFGDTNTSKPMYPTLNTYSRLEIGEQDCAMAWQDGPPDVYDCSYGNKIYYTHLRATSTQVLRELGRGAILNISGFVTVDNNRVGLLSSNFPPQDVLYHGKPTLYRALTDFGQSAYDNRESVADSVGLINHKADRIAWMSRHLVTTSMWPPQQTWMPMKVIRRPVDAYERSLCTFSNTTDVKSWPQGELIASHDVRNPELSMGEQSTEWQAIPRAASWDFSDTSMILSFDYSEPSANSADGRLLELQMGWKAFALPGPNTPWSAMFTGDAHLVNVSQRGRHHHVSARHSIAHMRGLTQMRRLFEQRPFIDGLHAQAPFIGRSAQGFYKGAAEADDAGLTLRRYRGLRSEEFAMLLSEVTIDGIERPLELEQLKNGTLVSQWIPLSAVSAVELKSRASGNSPALSAVWLEKRSDGQRTALDVLIPMAPEQSGLHSSKANAWTVIAQADEQVRLVIESTDPEAMPAEDLEIVPQQPRTIGIVPAESGKQSQGWQPSMERRYIDLRKSTNILSGADQALHTIAVIPQPATGMAVLIARSIPADEIIIETVGGVEVARVQLLGTRGGDAIADVDASRLTPGLYVARTASGSARGLFIVTH